MNDSEKNTEPGNIQPEMGLFDLLLYSLKDLFNLLQDIRFAAIILVFLAFATLIGTALPQVSLTGETAKNQLIEKFGSGFYSKVMHPAGFDRVFQTVWYRFLLVLIVCSVTLCAYGRTKSVTALSRIKNPITSEKGIKSLKTSGSKEFPDYESAYGWIRKNFQNRGFRLFEAEKDREHHFFGRKNLVSKWMLVAMHYSFVIILLGAIIGARFGKAEVARIFEGDTWRTSDGKAGIRLVDYWIEYNKKDYPDVGSFYMEKSAPPTDYKSKVEVLDSSDKVIREAIIEVNKSLNHGGYRFYQSSWSFAPVLSIYQDDQLVLQAPAEGDSVYRVAESEIVFSVPSRGIVSGKHSIENEDKTRSIEELAPMCILLLQTMGEEGSGVTCYVNLPPPTGEVKLPTYPDQQPVVLKMGEPVEMQCEGTKYRIELDGILESTILDVKRDPGVGFVFLGFVICVIGGTVGLFAPYATARMIIRESRGKHIVWWGTSSSVNAPGSTENK
jgi:cytochrome c biogenesis protein ResB